MASPLSRNIIAGAIGESGSLLAKQSTVTLAEAEQAGLRFAKAAGVSSLAALRAMPAEQLLEETAKPGLSRFPVAVDGYFLPQSPLQIFSAGAQAKVPLLVGWNSHESSYKSILGQEDPTEEKYINVVKKRFGESSGEVLKAYSSGNGESVPQVATDLAGDLFIGFGTWKWSDMQAKTGFQQTLPHLARSQAKYEILKFGHCLTTRQLTQIAAHCAG